MDQEEMRRRREAVREVVEQPTHDADGIRIGRPYKPGAVQRHRVEPGHRVDVTDSTPTPTGEMSNRGCLGWILGIIAVPVIVIFAAIYGGRLFYAHADLTPDYTPQEQSSACAEVKLYHSLQSSGLDTSSGIIDSIDDSQYYDSLSDDYDC